MKRITIILATVFLLCGVASAQQPKAKTSEIKMPAEYAVKISELQSQSQKLADENSKLISAWQEYTSQQNAMRGELTKLILRAALAAHMTIEQVDNSDLAPDGKGGYEWRPRPEVETAKAPK